MTRDVVVGISCYYHDSAAALVIDGVPVAAAHEERYSRRKHDPGFPRNALLDCLRLGGVGFGDVTGVAFYEDPRLKFRRVLASLAHTGRDDRQEVDAVLDEWCRWKRKAHVRVRDAIRELAGGAAPPVHVFGHHESHAASAFIPSPFRDAAVLCADSVGEWATTTLWDASGSRRRSPLRLLRTLDFPHSLGLLYSAFTYFCGFTVDSGEYKLMGLAPYGEPVYENVIRDRLVDVRPDGSLRLNLDAFEFLRGRTMTGDVFERLLGGPRREPEGPITRRECDLAASVQKVAEETMVAMARHVRELTGRADLCLAGGVALNCVANGRIAESGLFERVWIQPAAGDAGGALGAALLLAARRGTGRRDHVDHGGDLMQGALLGSSYTDAEIQRELDALHAVYERLPMPELHRRTAELLRDEAVVGWFQGRSEYGPRALGSRSILGDARQPTTQRRMNLKIKFRESFRPFAPAVLAEHAQDYFALTQDSPYMLLIGAVKADPVGVSAGPPDLDSINDVRSAIPAVTHVDHSARVQTVGRDRHPVFHELLTAFHAATGCPVLVNTSFNVRGEPIVNSPRDAYTCFMRTHIDALAIGPFLLLKHAQPLWHETDWRATIPLD